jgi:hypothetical protein
MPGQAKSLHKYRPDGNSIYLIGIDHYTESVIGYIDQVGNNRLITYTIASLENLLKVSI